MGQFSKYVLFLFPFFLNGNMWSIKIEQQRQRTSFWKYFHFAGTTFDFFFLKSAFNKVVRFPKIFWSFGIKLFRKPANFWERGNGKMSQKQFVFYLNFQKICSFSKKYYLRFICNRKTLGLIAKKIGHLKLSELNAIIL